MRKRLRKKLEKRRREWYRRVAAEFLPLLKPRLMIGKVVNGRLEYVPARPDEDAG